jgi:hypothetical protein
MSSRERRLDFPTVERRLCAATLAAAVVVEILRFCNANPSNELADAAILS